MDESDFNNFVEKRYEEQIRWYDKNASKHKNYYQILQTILLILSSATPVLIAINICLTEYDYLKWITIVIGIIVAVIASALRIFKFHDNWITYRNICETLKKEIYYYQSGSKEYLNCDDKKSLFVERVEDLISKQNNLWNTFVTKEN